LTVIDIISSAFIEVHSTMPVNDEEKIKRDGIKQKALENALP
jgi:hypothetical protein